MLTPLILIWIHTNRQTDGHTHTHRQTHKPCKMILNDLCKEFARAIIILHYYILCLHVTCNKGCQIKGPKCSIFNIPINLSFVSTKLFFLMEMEISIKPFTRSYWTYNRQMNILLLYYMKNDSYSSKINTFIIYE